MKTEFAIVITTTSENSEANKISQLLLDEKLAACIQVSQIKSFYSWKGKMNVDDEFQLLIKSNKNDFEKIEQLIKANHSYDVPEIIQVPIINGSKEYLNWIKEVTE